MGNIRAVVSGDGRVLETNNYYPYGMQIKPLSQTYYTSSDVKNRYKYNGKELFSDNGLQWLNYGARMYDAAVARWWVQDPLAEKYYSLTPYNYVAGNPVGLVDPNGMDFEEWTKERRQEDEELDRQMDQSYLALMTRGSYDKSMSERYSPSTDEAGPGDPPKGKKDSEENSTLSEIKLFLEKADDWSYTWGPDAAYFILDITAIYPVIENIKILKTGQDFEGNQKENKYTRYINPSLQILLSIVPGGAKTDAGKLSETAIRYMIGKGLSDSKKKENDRQKEQQNRK